jgi:hypothetical protein
MPVSKACGEKRESDTFLDLCTKRSGRRLSSSRLTLPERRSPSFAALPQARPLSAFRPASTGMFDDLGVRFLRAGPAAT